VLRWKDKPFVLDLHQESVVLSRQNKTFKEIVAECPFKGGSPALAVESCIRQLPHNTAQIEVVFDDSYARFWHVTPPLHASRLSDLQTAASVRFETLFGMPGDDWVIEAAWHAKRPSSLARSHPD
jgi:hypothetical protein